MDLLISISLLMLSFMAALTYLFLFDRKGMRSSKSGKVRNWVYEQIAIGIPFLVTDFKTIVWGWLPLSHGFAKCAAVLIGVVLAQFFAVKVASVLSRMLESRTLDVECRPKLATAVAGIVLLLAAFPFIAVPLSDLQEVGQYSLIVYAIYVSYLFPRSLWLGRNTKK